MNRGVALGLLAAAGLALALRCPQLDARPMHTDEAANAVKFGQLWEHGAYRYDPNEHHGPVLYYATLALAWLTRAPDYAHFTETRLRLVTILFGVGLILLLPLVADGMGGSAVIWAGIFTAVSPAMVFYSRYFIHETPLVFFTFLALATGWRYFRSGKIGWALLAGAAVGLMDATKETFVFALAAAAGALLLNSAWSRWIDAAHDPQARPRVRTGHVLTAGGVWLAVALVLFSSFFTNASGPLDSLRTYLPWFQRIGVDSPHAHPWNFYLGRLVFFHAAKGPVWSEALILALGLVGAAAAFRRQGLADAHAGFVRFLALFTLALAAAYSFIPYKTPWCLLGFWHGTILLAGVGAAVVVRRAKPRWLKIGAVLLLLAGAGQLAWQAWRASVSFSADQRNPYVYAQTSPDILELVSEVEALAKTSPQGRAMPVEVIAPESDYWPLPWYLRRFSHVGWWDNVPAELFAPVMVVSSKLQSRLDEQKKDSMRGYFQLRPGTFFELYVEPDLWREFLEKNSSKAD